MLSPSPYVSAEITEFPAEAEVSILDILLVIISGPGTDVKPGRARIAADDEIASSRALYHAYICTHPRSPPNITTSFANKMSVRPIIVIAGVGNGSGA